MAGGEVRIKGLKEFEDSVRRLPPAVQGQIDKQFGELLGGVAQRARSRVPTASGQAKSTVQNKGLQLMGGGQKAPYYGWLDFGGKVGIRKTVSRPFLKKGRYLFFEYSKVSKQVVPLMAKVLDKAGSEAGLEVS